MNKIVFISGASKGIGLAIANAFNKNGYDVIGTARSKFTFSPENTSVKMLPIQLDITSRESVKNLPNKLKDLNLMPSIIINNAGITSDQLFVRMSDDDWDNVINTNLNGVFNITKVFIKHLIKSKSGRIINITVNSIAPGFIETDMTAYLSDDDKLKLIDDIPLKQFGHVNDIAELAMFLAGEKGAYITGQTISVDGGLFMY